MMTSTRATRALGAILPWVLAALPLTCHADHATYGVDQKGYGAKQKGCPEPHYLPPHRHLCEPPPELPLLQSVAIMRVAGPDRRVRLRVEQESGAEPESAKEPCEPELAELRQRLDRLEMRFDLLFQSVQKLVDQLQP